MIELLLAYAAGLLTLINPCVLPVVPLVLASSVERHRHGPALLALGMGVSFVAFGMLVSTLGYALGLTPERLTAIGASVMIAFGLVLLVPSLHRAFGRVASTFAARADSGLARVEGTAGGSASTAGLAATAVPSGSPWVRQLLGGVLLGAVWSPCIGPTLGSAIGLASTGDSLLWVAAIMTSFALGVASLIVVLGYGSRQAIRQRLQALKALAARSRYIVGAVFLAVGLAMLTGLTALLEGWLLEAMPAWLIDLSVAI